MSEWSGLHTTDRSFLAVLGAEELTWKISKKIYDEEKSSNTRQYSFWRHYRDDSLMVLHSTLNFISCVILLLRKKKKMEIVYAVQQDTQSFLNDWVYSSHMLARHVSDLTGPSSGGFYMLYVQIWYVL